MARKPTAGPHRFEYELGKRDYDFSTQIDRIIVDTEAKVLAVVRTGIQATIDEMQTPVAKGGKMRVDTGFLRSSGTPAIGVVPSGAGRGERKEPNSYSWNGDALGVVLAKMKMGDVFYWGWTANYAKYREAYDGFLEAALMNWQKNIDEAVRRFKK